MLGRPILTQDQLQGHVTQLTQQDIIWNPLYDAATYTGTNGQTSLTFFATPQGQGTTSAPSASGSKTIQDTNLTAAGQLTKGNAFYMTGQELLFFPGVSPESAINVTAAVNFLNDVYTFGKNGVLTLTVGSNRIYLQDGPLSMFPPATRIAMAAAVSGGPTNSITEIAYGVQSGEVYTIVPLYIEATLGFTENLTWAVAQALPSATNARIFSRLRGYLNRQAQ